MTHPSPSVRTAWIPHKQVTAGGSLAALAISLGSTSGILRMPPASVNAPRTAVPFGGQQSFPRAWALAAGLLP